jgi:phosphatidylglycerophosphate synthase
MDQRIIDSQKPRDVLAAFLARKVSRHITALLVKTPITPNQTTVLWGAISATNSYVVYRVLVGDYWLLPIVVALYAFAYVLDCVDGEIARFRRMANPIGGKLIDGICHRFSEYSLLAAYVFGAATLTASPWVLPVGLALLSGEAMFTYSYERRVATLRVDLGFKGLIRANAESMYVQGDRWRDLSWRRRIRTFQPLFQYKSAYAAIAVAYVSGIALLIGLGLLAAYKHFSWVRLIAGTLSTTAAALREAPAVDASETATRTVEAI